MVIGGAVSETQEISPFKIVWFVVRKGIAGVGVMKIWLREKIEKQIVLNWCRRFRTIGYLENFSVFWAFVNGLTKILSRIFFKKIKAIDLFLF